MEETFVGNDQIAVSSDGQVRTVWLNRPLKHNALTDGMLITLTQLFVEPPSDGQRVTVIRGRGRSFCSGRDLSEWDESSGRLGSFNIEETFAAVERYPLPVIAVVQGKAIAGGNELALHCDFVVASTAASFGMSLAQIGLSPTWFLAKRLLEVGGPVFAREMLLLGDAIPASRMAALGLIHDAVAPHRLDGRVQEVVDRIVSNAPMSSTTIKSLLLRQMTFRDAIPHDDVDELVKAVRDSRDASEGIAARLEQRPAHFIGA